MREITHYGELLQSGAISRREFIGRLTALGLTVGAATALAPSFAKASPNKGGRLRLGLTGGATSDTIDPALLRTFTFNISAGQIRNCLTEIAANGSLIGELAESWEASPGATVWTFQIRQGVEFHSGKSLDATDVIESLNYHRGDGSPSGAKAFVSTIDDIRADGKNTVVVTLNGGNADFPFLMSDYRLAICPATAGGGIDWQSGIGTGSGRSPGARARPPSSPLIVTAVRHLEHLAQPPHRELAGQLLDDRVLHRGRSEKIANAFFRMSRSCRTRRRSRRSCCPSRSWSGIFPAPGNAVTPCSWSCLRHLVNMPRPTPRSRATSDTGWPSCVTILTASILNSRLYRRRDPMLHLRAHYRASKGVREIGGGGGGGHRIGSSASNLAFVVDPKLRIDDDPQGILPRKKTTGLTLPRFPGHLVKIHCRSRISGCGSCWQRGALSKRRWKSGVDFHGRVSFHS